MKKLLLFIGSLLFISCSVTPSNPIDNLIGIGIGSTPDLASLAPTSDYVIYYDNATLPTLYSAINLLTHTKPSFMYMGRSGTFDTDQISHLTMIDNDEGMISKIAELNTANPSATFTFYVNENRFSRVFNYFYRQGISKDRVRVVQISDGTLTYINWADHLGGASSFNKWRVFEDRFNKEFNKINSTTPLDGEFFAHTGVQYTPTVLHSSYEYWMQWPELLTSSSTDLKNYLNENGKRYYKVDPLKYYKSLPDNKQQDFLTLVGLDKQWKDGEGGGTLNNQTIGEALDTSPKPNIIITGASASDSTKLNDYIVKLKTKYGDDYDYFYKGHPAYMETKPSDTSIVILPFKLPMEAIIWAFGDNIDIMGGYDSSLYMNAPKEMDKFFFGEKGTTLVPPLNLMFKQGLLGNVYFFN